MKNIKNICCIGAGYVGGPSMAVFADHCPEITFNVVDLSIEKINLWNGDFNKLPVYEPGLKQIIKRVRDKNLFFSNNIDKSINDAELIFISVNTPPIIDKKGDHKGTNLDYLISCVENIAKIAKTDKIIVEKSTVPVRTAALIQEILATNNKKCKFTVLSNPEFLAEGTAVYNLENPDRVLIGSENTTQDKEALEALIKIYKNWIPEEKLITTNLWSSELSKLASNAMLAQRVSSINSFSALCDKTGADIIEVSQAIGLDHRIGSRFLNPSVGFGGSCFQKDLLNLVYLCQHYGLDEAAEYWLQVLKINDYQKSRLINKAIQYLDGSLENKDITLYGWSFKKNTNDSRESASIKIAYEFLLKKAKLKIYDPQSSNEIVSRDLLKISKNNRKILDNVTFINDPYLAADKSNCICILTEWEEFKELDWNIIIDKMINQKVIIDGRYILKDILYDRAIYL